MYDKCSLHTVEYRTCGGAFLAVCVSMRSRLCGVISATVRLLVYVRETRVKGKRRARRREAMCVCALLYLSSRPWSLVTPCSFAKPTVWDAGIDRANRRRALKIERGGEKHVQFAPSDWTHVTICTVLCFIYTGVVDSHHSCLIWDYSKIWQRSHKNWDLQLSALSAHTLPK